MSAADVVLLSGLVFAAALLYTSVGHAGASGYLAAMALFGLAPAVMKPTALTLNILVASFAVMRLRRAGLVNWRPLVPLVLGSIPLAFVGGAIQLPGHWYRILVGLVLLAASGKFLFDPRDTEHNKDARAVESIPIGPAFLAGALIGLLSGLTGTGGGIFLSPLLMFLGWAGARQQAGITAPFILVNSIAGLGGNLVSLQSLPSELPFLVAAALAGAVAGTQLGIRWFSGRALQRALGVVLVIAAAKFLFTGAIAPT